MEGELLGKGRRFETSSDEENCEDEDSCDTRNSYRNSSSLETTENAAFGGAKVRIPCLKDWA